MTPHMLLRVAAGPDGWWWRCTCGARGPLVTTWDTARTGHAIHRERTGERVQ